MCSRELSIAVAGSEDVCIRHLKTWLLFGATLVRKRSKRNNAKKKFRTRGYRVAYLTPGRVELGGPGV